jgi:hypothetical protein
VESLTELAAAIRQRRGTDTVIAFEPAVGFWPVALEQLDRFVEKFGLSGIGERWREIAREAAVSLTTTFLARDLAYKMKLMSDVEARELAERFVGAFGPGARFFTNADDPAGESWSWDSLTGSTFDAGVIGVDTNTIGVIAVEDED